MQRKLLCPLDMQFCAAGNATPHLNVGSVQAAAVLIEPRRQRRPGRRRRRLHRLRQRPLGSHHSGHGRPLRGRAAPGRGPPHLTGGGHGGDHGSRERAGGRTPFWHDAGPPRAAACRRYHLRWLCHEIGQRSRLCSPALSRTRILLQKAGKCQPAIGTQYRETSTEKAVISMSIGTAHIGTSVAIHAISTHKYVQD